MKKIRFFLLSFILFLCRTSLSYSAYLDLSWNPNGEADLAGYRVYYGTSSGTYGSPLDVENVTTYRLTGLNDGVRYYVALTAYDTSNNESAKSVEINGIPPDTQSPTVTITSPTSSSTFVTANSTITVAGSATDNLDVTQVNWVNSRGGSGTAVGTDSWSAATIILLEGNNIISVTAHDAAQNSGTDSITISYTPPITTTSSSTSTVNSTSTSTVPPTTTTTAPVTTTTTPITTTQPPSTSTSTVPPTTTTTAPATTTTTPITTTQPPSTSTSTVPPTTTTTAPVTTTTTPITTTQPPSTSTSTVPPTTTTTAPVTTTTTPITTTQPPSTSTSSTILTTTTTSIEEETASCDEPEKLLPLSLTASSELRPFFGTDNLVDGDPQTAWSTLLSFFRKDASITMDMGSAKIITSLSMYASSLFGIDVLPANIEIQLSNDNTTWETLNSAAFSTSLQPPYADSWELNGHKCRYIKVLVTGRKTFFFFQLARIAELEVYGCEQTTHLPFSAENSSPSEPLGLKGFSNNRSGQTASMTPGIPGKPLVTFK